VRREQRWAKTQKNRGVEKKKNLTKNLGKKTDRNTFKKTHPKRGETGT